MRPFFAALLLLSSFVLGGCASGPLVMPGEPEQNVIARMGPPAYRYMDGNQTLLEYPGGYYGQRTFMARIGPDGRLISVEQVRTVEKFASIRLNESTKDDVLRIVGTPSETSWLSLPQLEVWSYRYRENEVWNSMMHIHFDRAGIVRKMENARDPLYEEDDFLFRNRLRPGRAHR